MRRVSIAAVWLGLCLRAATLPCAGALAEDDVRARYEQSHQHERARNYAEAIKALMPVHTDRSQDYTVNMRLGWLHYLNGNQAGAKTYYAAAMKAAPASIEAKLGYTLPLMAQNNHQETETIARQVIQVDRLNYTANLRLSYALRMQGKYNLSEEVADRMLRLYPTDVYFLTELAFAKLWQKQNAKAVEAFENVLLLQPDNQTAKEQLAKLGKGS